MLASGQSAPRTCYQRAIFKDNFPSGYAYADPTGITPTLRTAEKCCIRWTIAQNDTRPGAVMVVQVTRHCHAWTVYSYHVYKPHILAKQSCDSQNVREEPIPWQLH